MQYGIFPLPDTGTYVYAQEGYFRALNGEHYYLYNLGDGRFLISVHQVAGPIFVGSDDGTP